MALDLESQYATALTPLHHEIEAFVEAVVPTPEEKIYFEDLASIVDEMVVDLLGRRAKVAPIGGFAMGLSTHASDLDLLVQRVVRVHSNGMRVGQRARAVKIFYSLARKLAESKALKIKAMRVVPRARVPVLKVATADGTAMDISLHNDSGIKAASHMRRTMQKYPPSIPVIIVLKCMLRQAGLADVHCGGLGGYALANMVLAHCMQLRAMGRPDLDYGEVLLGFLELFGHDFDFVWQAVSSRRGEIIEKSVLEKETLEWIRNTDNWQGRTKGMQKPFIEDPLTGQNLATGTTRFLKVQKCFRDAHLQLIQNQNGRDGFLSQLIDTEKEVERRGYAPVDHLWPVKRALKREGRDRQKAREDIRAAKKQQAHEPYRRSGGQKPGRQRQRPSAVLSAEASSLMVLR